MKEFKTMEEAMEWMTDAVDDPFIDNQRFAFDDDSDALDMYFAQKVSGCCGFFDQEIIVGGRRAQIGCNYGH